MKIGIDKIGFATAQYVLNMDDLAESRYVDPDKYSKGLLLNNLSITPVNDDIVTLRLFNRRPLLYLSGST